MVYALNFSLIMRIIISIFVPGGALKGEVFLSMICSWFEHYYHCPSFGDKLRELA